MTKHTLHIQNDEAMESPRVNYDHMGIMATFCSNHSIGDKNAVEAIVEAIQKTRPGFSFDVRFDKAPDLEQACEKAGFLVIPIYAYIHSGVTISSSPFSCRWDSDQAGFIVATKAAIRENFNVKRITAQTIEQARKLLKAEIKETDLYLTSGGYGFTLYKGGEEVNSCWGFLGDDHTTNGMLDNMCLTEDEVKEMTVVQAHEEFNERDLAPALPMAA